MLKRLFTLALGIAVLSTAGLAFSAYSAEAATPALRIEPVVWQYDADYGGNIPSEGTVPVHTVYIKTHDGTDWMSTYDHSSKAINGPEAIKQTVAEYKKLGIDVVAWFVPTASADIDGQIAMAETVIDTGVTALYADVEPFDQFCEKGCPWLAQTFWPRLRAERPNARLGVIYVPLEPHRTKSDVAAWFANADVALPMCYWDTYEGDSPWDTPWGCVTQAYYDLQILANGRHVDYIPMVQGDTSPPKMREALDAATHVGSTAVSLWRRGAVPREVWNDISAYPGVNAVYCAAPPVDGCLTREVLSAQTWVIAGGAKLPLPADGIAKIGGDVTEVQYVPTGYLATLPDRPKDGTLLRESDGDAMYWMLGGAAFKLNATDAARFRLDATKAIAVPASVIGGLPSAPEDFAVIQESGSTQPWVILRGTRIPTDIDAVNGLLNANQQAKSYVVPVGSLQRIPLGWVSIGDVDCDGSLSTADAMHLLALDIGSTTALCDRTAGDVNCDGQVTAEDGLVVLRFSAGVRASADDECSPPGTPHNSGAPRTETPSTEPAPKPTPTRTPQPTG